MKKLHMILAMLAVFLISACTKECPMIKFDSSSCEFGYYQTKVNGCMVPACRPTENFSCESLNTGDTYFDGCNTCTCEKEGASCTLKFCADNEFEGKMCGGIQGLDCDPGYKCFLDGDYPDASGKCVPV